jgi:hypothetical protein
MNVRSEGGRGKQACGEKNCEIGPFQRKHVSLPQTKNATGTAQSLPEVSHDGNLVVFAQGRAGTKLEDGAGFIPTWAGAIEIIAALPSIISPTVLYCNVPPVTLMPASG